MDAFARMGMAPRLVMSDEELRTAFREAGKQLHPDGGGCEADFSKLQEAYVTLTSPARRLKHWLALHGGGGEDRGSIDPGLMDLFGSVGLALQEADTLIRKRSEARTALVLAMLEGSSQACRDVIESQLARVDSVIAGEMDGFPDIESGAVTPEEAARHARNLAFLEKWRANLQERFARLV